MLFRSFISGFTIKRKYVLPYLTDCFDGTLLFQLYLMAEVVLKYPSVYFNEFLTQAYEGGVPYFGSSEVEKSLYTPGTITVENSLNFLKGFFDITSFMDRKYNFNSTLFIKRDMSKYFYPSLSIQRNKGIREFLRYIKELNLIGFNITFYYYIYVAGLLFFGKNFCDFLIRKIKDVLGQTPEL